MRFEQRLSSAAKPYFNPVGPPPSSAHSCAAASNSAIGLGLTPATEDAAAAEPARAGGVTTIESNAASSWNDDDAILEASATVFWGGNRPAKNGPCFSWCVLAPWFRFPVHAANGGRHHSRYGLHG